MSNLLPMEDINLPNKK